MPRVDPQTPARIRDDLKGVLKGNLHFDDITRSLYSTDASIFQVQPLGVFTPADEADLCRLVHYAHQHSIPLIPRGAGTGLAGEALGTGLVLDLSKHFRDIVEIDDDWVRVQPGVTLRALNERLAPLGRRFSPNPASGMVCTIGGMLATNASGSNSLKHGYTGDNVRELRIVLDNGDAVKVGREPWPVPHGGDANHGHDILQALGVLLEDNAELLRQSPPRPAFDRCGYRVDILREGVLDLPRLLIGSEGTLALFTEATLKTTPLPAGRALVLLGFTSLEGALAAARSVREFGPLACDLIDRRLLNLARANDAPRLASLVASKAEAILLVEFESDDPDSARRDAQRLVAAMSRGDSPAFHVVAAVDPAEIDGLWQLREVVLPSLFGMKGGAQPIPFVEDIGVPVERLSEFVRTVQETLQEHETTASFLIHACTGQVHTRPFLDLAQPNEVSKLSLLAEKIHTLALNLGGTISTQHGVGLARTPWVARQAGPLYPLYRQVKAIFDPQNLFNPGKIVDPDPDLAAWPLRPWQPATIPNGWKLHLTPDHVVTEVNHCNGCGQCRTETPSQRMCPIFRATHAEAAAPRAKANLLRQVMLDANAAETLSSDQVRSVADLCVHCKMCAQECPARVNIPRLMVEAKAANIEQHGHSRSTWLISHLEGLLRMGSTFPGLTNFVLGSSGFRWVMDKILGLSRLRKLPALVRYPFTKLALQKGWTRRRHTGRPTVGLFVDLYANYFDPSLAESAVLVLEHQGFEVVAPAGLASNGMAALAEGDLETARELGQRNLRAFVEMAREEIPIVCLEPTAAVMFKQDLLDLMDDTDARIVAGQAVELSSFLHQLHQQGRLKPVEKRLEMSVGHHVPCHVKVLENEPAGPKLLKLIPGLHVETLDVSCSGMAGLYGLKSKTYASSLAAGKPMLDLLREPRLRNGSTECSSCRMQMEGVVRKKTYHPVQYLAWAYGLMARPDS